MPIAENFLNIAPLFAFHWFVETFTAITGLPCYISTQCGYEFSTHLLLHCVITIQLKFLNFYKSISIKYKYHLPSAPSDLQMNSKFIDTTGSTVQVSNNFEEIHSSSENLLTSDIIVQRPPELPIPVAPAINPVITPRLIHIPDA